MPKIHNTGVNHAASLPGIDNQDLRLIIGTRLSEYVIKRYRRTLPLMLFLDIEMDVDLCSGTTYLCEDTTDLPNMADSAIDAVLPRFTIKPPKTVTFQGFCVGGFETKLAKEQMDCINKSEILRNWYQTSLLRAIEDGKESLMARFYRHLLTHAVHPANTGNNAGMVTGGKVLGTPSNPVWIRPDTVDSWHMEIIDVTKQMPRSAPVEQEFGATTENMFLFGPAELESIYMKSDNYNDWLKVGDCNKCSMFTDTFGRMPRGIMPITSYCIETRTIQSGGQTCKVYPVLFGHRYSGTKAALRVDTSSYKSVDGDSIFFRTKFYWHIHTYDARHMGLSWITIDNPRPETKQCG